MKKNLFIILFVVAFCGVFAGILQEEKWIDYLFKPLIMISLAGHFVVNSAKTDKTIVKFALLAFLFSWLGDLLLMFTEKGMLFFMLGLVGFLIAQINYILLFNKSVQLAGAKPFLRQNIYWLILYGLYGSVLYVLLFNKLDQVLKAGVFIYMLALLGMSAMALNRLNVIPRTSAVLVFAGSVLFVLSDTLIAFDKFYMPIPFDRLLVMFTYMTAQYLIVKGIIKQFN